MVFLRKIPLLESLGLLLFIPINLLFDKLKIKKMLINYIIYYSI